MKMQKTKIWLLMALHPIFSIDGYAHQESDREAEEKHLDAWCIQEGESFSDTQSDKVEGENTQLRFKGDIAFKPSLSYQDSQLKGSQSFKVTLEAIHKKLFCLCSQPVEVNVSMGLDPSSIKLTKTKAKIGELVTMGYGGETILKYRNSAGLPISIAADVAYVQLQHCFGLFKLGYGLEQPVSLQLGLFDHKKSQDDKANKIDEEDKGPFKVGGDLPAFGISLGAEVKQFNLGLSGLGRFSNYTHDPDGQASKDKLDSKYLLTWGTNLGLQYTVIPDRLKWTVEGGYVSGLGDYISGLSGIQQDKKRKEMCAVYYKDKTKDELKALNVWGAGGALELSATKCWIVALSGAYLQVLDQEGHGRPAQAFDHSLSGTGRVTYKHNEYLSIATEYGLSQEHVVDDAESKGMKHAAGVAFKISF